MSLFLRNAALIPPLALLAATPALAGGFYLQEQSPKETGRAMSGGAAAADDPSVLFYNPAGMTALPGVQLSAGINALMARARQDNRGSVRSVPGVATAVPVTGGDGGQAFESVIPIPSAYVTAQLSDRLWAGIGVNAPFGLKLKYDDDFIGRYDSLYTDLKTYNIQPSLAYKLNDNLAIGGGIDVQYVKVTLTNALPNLSPLQPDGAARVRGKDWTIGWNAGIFYTSGATHFGLHYRSAIKHHLSGRYQVSGLLGPIAAGNADLPATAPLDLPDIVTGSIAHSFTPTTRAMVTARWYNWSRFQRIAITPQGAAPSVKELGYRDSFSVALGAEHDLSEQLTLRAGTMYDKTPTNSDLLTTRVPDGNRLWLTTGASWSFSPALTLNLSYAHTFVKKADIVRPDVYYGGTAAAVTTTTLARTSGRANQVAASITARF
ncbi:OmpP1/FadL family transporter [Sphingomonas quercus]|uniref:OmpP1/FadL family transporter n=1 Tax=Sphingomonas quercus TaxID=2842451 RepID=A0ABS6BJ95_9SPHN|nr:outer membrane protein transport protein [Sphingomonas quercus]MBU3077891.1 OmpP1/FadL family transporter [Sphingomonas quercus]